MKKYILVLFLFICGIFITASSTFAHVVVRPSEVGIGARVNFVVSVPTEEDVPTTQIRLVIPEQLQSVRPNVKPGWNIELVKSGEGEDARVTEIIWSGGNIPAEQRDEFVFSSQAPSQKTTLVWRAYQTYANGNVVAWDKSPITVEEYETNNPESDQSHTEDAPSPYSETQVTNDLDQTDSQESLASTNSTRFSIFALVLSALALIVTLRRKN
ncbi:MAG TPA: YcnI family protein [Candidatus Levybacteria bacterium]|nr:YcnI family protein [Candidatus Levybacteria bacterium]